jgi:predicted naringenin-chalcone synthase
VLTGAGSAFPPACGQRELWDGYFSSHYGGRRAARVAFAASGVQRRHAVANPLLEDVSTWSTGRRMARFVEEATPLAKEALTAALDAAGRSANELGMLAVASCTGYATPGLDVLVARDLAMAPDLRRLLVGHVGCHAALPGLASIHDYVVANGRPAALLCVELTSLHVQPPSDDLEQVVVHALFGDAASALVLEPVDATGPGGPSPASPALEVVELATLTAPGTLDLMTWDITDLGFRMGLSRHVPDVVGAHVGALVEQLLGPHGIAPAEVAGWAVHPGGPRVLDVVTAGLGLGEDVLDDARAVLAEHGNCSSPTILLVLERVRRRLVPGDLAVALTFGPGLTLYGCLLRAVE